MNACDPKIKKLLSQEDDFSFRAELESLIDTCMRPIMQKAILDCKKSSGNNNDASESQTARDVAELTLSHLGKFLETQHRQLNDSKLPVPISNMNGYIIETARHAWYAYLRTRDPKRFRMDARLASALRRSEQRQGHLARWVEKERDCCGIKLHAGRGWRLMGDVIDDAQSERIWTPSPATVPEALTRLFDPAVYPTGTVLIYPYREVLDYFCEKWPWPAEITTISLEESSKELENRAAAEDIDLISLRIDLGKFIWSAVSRWSVNERIIY